MLAETEIFQVRLFDDVPTDIVLQACEAVLERSRQASDVNLNGVALRCFMNHLDGLDRCMLIGDDWSAGFNISIPSPSSPNVYQIFGSEYEVTTPGVENWDSFRRDMTILTITQQFWSDHPPDEIESPEDHILNFIKSSGTS
jgi:hypothetical protein